MFALSVSSIKARELIIQAFSLLLSAPLSLSLSPLQISSLCPFLNLYSRRRSFFLRLFAPICGFVFGFKFLWVWVSVISLQTFLILFRFAFVEGVFLFCFFFFPLRFCLWKWGFFRGLLLSIFFCFSYDCSYFRRTCVCVFFPVFHLLWSGNEIIDGSYFLKFCITEIYEFSNWECYWKLLLLKKKAFP